MSTEVPRPVLKGKKALITGIANEYSIAYGCTRTFREVGAELALTYLNEKARAFVKPLADELGASMFMTLDVSKAGELESVFAKQALSASLTDVGIDDQFMKNLSEKFQPGCSALFTLVRKADPGRVGEAFLGFGGKVLVNSVSKERESLIQEFLDTEKEIGE